jgi:hypothetical protein
MNRLCKSAIPIPAGAVCPHAKETKKSSPKTETTDAAQNLHLERTNLVTAETLRSPRAVDSIGVHLHIRTGRNPQSATSRLALHYTQKPTPNAENDSKHLIRTKLSTSYPRIFCCGGC